MKRLFPILIAAMLLLLLCGCAFDTASFGLSGEDASSSKASTVSVAQTANSSVSSGSTSSSNNSSSGTISSKAGGSSNSSSASTVTTSSSTPISDAKEKEMKQKMQSIIDELKMSE